jgi:NAD(P)-dependent dehydrogenase (short-subunit alcohol dehydrogenase family)
MNAQRVLITGAASGLGAALAQAFTARGDEVLATDLDELDVTYDEDWERARARVEQQWGGLDVLVNNAGIATGGRIDVADLEEWHRAIEVNLLGAVRGCRTFVPMFKRQRSGTIVNIASLAGLVHPPAMASYTATKAGVVALSESLRHELRPWGIDVVAVCPGFFRTNLATSVASADPVTAELTGSLIARSDLTADDIAAAVLAELGSVGVILPDAAARAAVALKRNAPAEYEAQQVAFAERVHARA